MIRSNVASRIATLGPLGYVPGSGTLASLCMIPVILLFHYCATPLDIQAAFIIIFGMASFFIIRKSLRFFVDKDPAEIVLDECVGMLVAAYALPFSFLTLALAFLLFRLLDISKIFGVKWFESLYGEWGIVLDDVAAGLLANIILRLIVPLACQ